MNRAPILSAATSVALLIACSASQEIPRHFSFNGHAPSEPVPAETNGLQCKPGGADEVVCAKAAETINSMSAFVEYHYRHGALTQITIDAGLTPFTTTLGNLERTYGPPSRLERARTFSDAVWSFPDGQLTLQLRNGTTHGEFDASASRVSSQK